MCKECDVLHMRHVLVLYQNACDNAYLIRVRPVVYCVGQKIPIQ